MTRRIPIASITASSPGTPATFTIGALTPDCPTGDWRSVFHGKFFRQPAAPGVPLTPFQGPGTWPGTRAWHDANGDNIVDTTFSDTPPAGYELITATQFDVVDNASFKGRYTVFTKGTGGNLDEAADFAASQTTIRVIEPISSAAGNPDLTATGFIVNVSTYLLTIQGTMGFVVFPTTTLQSAITISGRNRSGWGEDMQQGMMDIAVNFSSATPPTNAFNGMTWFNPVTSILSVYSGGNWIVPGAAAFAPINSFRHLQSSAAATWTINHNLNASPDLPVNGGRGIVHLSLFVNDGGTVKSILPAAVTYVSENQLQVTFTTPYTGYALVRP